MEAVGTTRLAASEVHLLIILGEIDGDNLGRFDGSAFVRNYENILNGAVAELDSNLCCDVVLRDKGDYEPYFCKIIRASTKRALNQQMPYNKVVKCELICSEEPSVHSMVIDALKKVNSTVSILRLAFESSISANVWPRISAAISTCSQLCEIGIEFFGETPFSFPSLSSLAKLKDVHLFTREVTPNLLGWMEREILFTGEPEHLLADPGIDSIDLNSSTSIGDSEADRLSRITNRLAACLKRVPPLEISVDKAVILLSHLTSLTQLTISAKRMSLTMGTLVRMVSPLTSLEVLNLNELANNLSTSDDQLPDPVALPVTKLLVSFGSIKSHSRLHSSAWATYFPDLAIVELKGKLQPCTICSSGLVREDKENCNLLYLRDFACLPKLKQTKPVNVSKLGQD